VQKRCQKMPFHVTKNAEREVSFEWQRQLSHLKELKALSKMVEKLAVCNTGITCMYVDFMLRVYSLHVLKYPDLVLSVEGVTGSPQQ